MSREAIGIVGGLQQHHNKADYFGYGSEELDVLALLRSFSQADAVDRPKFANSSSSNSFQAKSMQPSAARDSRPNAALALCLLEQTVRYQDLISQMTTHNAMLCTNVVSHRACVVMCCV